MQMMLKNKVAVIYGAAGAVGSAVSRAFAREGAKLFLTGVQESSVAALAKEIVSAGGSAEAAVGNALGYKGIDKHLQSGVDQTGPNDISVQCLRLRNTQ